MPTTTTIAAQHIQRGQAHAAAAERHANKGNDELAKQHRAISRRHFCAADSMRAACEAG